MSFKRGPGLVQLKADLERARLKGIERMKDELVERVSVDAVKGEGGVVERSEPGQYPRKDDGDFIDAFGTTDEGVINTGEYAEALEFKPPSEGGRRTFGLAAEDESLHQAVIETIVGELRG